MGSDLRRRFATSPISGTTTHYAMKNDLVTKDVSQINLEHSFFHYTSRHNLPTIIERGLEPRIGENARHVERTPKIFFAEGERGVLTIIDVWLRWLTGKIDTGKLKYWLGTVIYMRLPFCIESIPNRMVSKSLASAEKRRLAYAEMRKTLEESVFLVLDLEEKVDFDYQDIDEVKKTYYASFLKLLYPSDSNLKDQTMEYWNLHTYSHKTIAPEKVALMTDGQTTSANEILLQMIRRNLDYVQTEREFLYEYYRYLQD